MQSSSILGALFLVLSLSSNVFAYPTAFYGYVPLASPSDQLFYTLYPQPNATAMTPLVVWLQGGPGASSQFGNFDELGPMDVNLNPRNTTWLTLASLLFIDNPVGTGWSYTFTNSFCTSDQEIGDGLVLGLRGFYEQHPEMISAPLYLFSESYGGKMVTFFATALVAAMQNNSFVPGVKLHGVAIGDGWVSPVSCMAAYPKYLSALGLITADDVAVLNADAANAGNAMEAGNGALATYYWGVQQNHIGKMTGGVDFYNVLQYTDNSPDITPLMKGWFRQQLGDLVPANFTFNAQGNDVFSALQDSFMRDSVAEVDSLLQSEVPVVVYNGEIDLIVAPLCANDWIRTLQWRDMSKFNKAPRVLQKASDGTPQAMRQRYKNLDQWTVLRAGHMVPADNGIGALLMLQTVLSTNYTTA